MIVLYPGNLNVAFWHSFSHLIRHWKKSLFFITTEKQAEHVLHRRMDAALCDSRHAA
uniref:Uncharacterized protein n=1 Tax=Anguilla anguilla TaxID=7936 RepID=A0A0E9XZU0_ANGAN